MKLLLYIYLVFCISSESFCQRIVRTDLGNYLSRNIDDSFTKVDSLINLNFKDSPEIAHLSDDDKSRYQNLKEYIILEDIKYFTKKIEISEQRTLNEYKLEQSLKIKNNALSNTFRNIEKDYIKDETKLLKDYDDLVKLSEEIQLAGNDSDHKKASQAINKFYKKYCNDRPAEVSVLRKPEIRSFNTKVKNDSLVETKANIPNKINLSNLSYQLKVDERRHWEITSVDSNKVLLTFTPEKFRNYYGDTPFLWIESSIEEVGKDKLLNLKFIFSSKDVGKGYGFVNKNDFIKIDFLKSQSIKLCAVDNYSPSIQSYTGYTIYQTQYRFENKADYKNIKEKHLDKIGVLWSRGYEEYPIYNMDFYFK